MTPSWYDVLGVDADADESEVRERFRAEIADLDPTDRRFRLLSKAAEVLLDPERRAAHDLDLAAQDPTDDEPWLESGDETTTSPPDRQVAVVPYATSTAGGEATGTTKLKGARKPKQARAESGRGLLVTTIVLGVFALLLVVGVGVSFARGIGGGSGGAGGLPDTRQVASAQAAAVAGIVPVLSYDYRHLDDDAAVARKFLTSAAADEYLQFVNGVVLDNAKRNRVVVDANVIASGISRTGEGRVDVVIFVDQAITNRQVTTPDITHNQVVAQMVDQDGSWLIGCLKTTPDGPCPT